MSTNKEPALPPDICGFIDTFARYEPDDKNELSPVIAVEIDFITQFAAVFNHYARPQRSDGTNDGFRELFSTDEVRNLLDNRPVELARQLARLSFEMIAQYEQSRGESISRDELHLYLEVAERWNVRIADMCDDEDIYFRELNQRLAVLRAHYGEIGNKKAVNAIGRYIWPYVFSRFSE
ncbi:hypothetical protein IPM09_02005 [Candidatus Saccharibacteria bacterium]|nr:MAG: hypothetical protein IPM09_02005 [Candidatus Saccharibacteria bacterium]